MSSIIKLHLLFITEYRSCIIILCLLCSLKAMEIETFLQEGSQCVVWLVQLTAASVYYSCGPFGQLDIGVKTSSSRLPGYYFYAFFILYFLCWHLLLVSSTVEALPLKWSQIQKYWFCGIFAFHSWSCKLTCNK